MRLHNSGNLIKRAQGKRRVVAAAVDVRRPPRVDGVAVSPRLFGSRRNQAERVHREPSGLAVVASARTHARS